MVNTKKRMRLCIALIVVNVAFIWGNSLLPAETSAALSGWVKNLLLFFLPDEGPSPVKGHGLLRKIAHVLEFASLGTLWCCYLLMGRKKLLRAYFPGLCTACIDETIQCFVPGRGPRVTDVVIDLVGFSLGIGTILLIQYLKSKKWRTQS